jgi:hypothetical protein
VDLVHQQLGADTVQQISQRLGTDPATTRGAISAALPMLLGALAHTAAQSGQAAVVDQAADAHADVLGAVAHLLGAPPLADGGGALGRVLGGNFARVQEGVSKVSGLDRQQAGRLVTILAPIVLGALARKKREEGLSQDALENALRQEQREAQRRAPTHIGGLVGGLMGQILGER